MGKDLNLGIDALQKETDAVSSDYGRPMDGSGGPQVDKPLSERKAVGDPVIAISYP